MANKSNRTRRIIYDNLKGVQFFEPDMELLREKNPGHHIFKKKYLKPLKHQLEILWELSNICDQEEIVKNRRAWFKSAEKKFVTAGIKELSALLKKLMNAETLVQAKALAVTVTEKAETLPESVKAETVKVLAEVMEMLSDKLDPEILAAKKAKEAKVAAVVGLLKIDIDTAKQSVLANYAKILEVKGKDQKAATLRPLLKEFLKKLESNSPPKPKSDIPKDVLPAADNTEKTGEATDEKREEVKADLGKENELKGDETEPSNHSATGKQQPETSTKKK